MKISINEICTYNFPCEIFFGLKWEIVCFACQLPFMVLAEFPYVVDVNRYVTKPLIQTEINFVQRVS